MRNRIKSVYIKEGAQNIHLPNYEIAYKVLNNYDNHYEILVDNNMTVLVDKKHTIDIEKSVEFFKLKKEHDRLSLELNVIKSKMDNLI